MGGNNHSSDELQEKTAKANSVRISGLLGILFWWCKEKKIEVEGGTRSPDGRGRLLNEGEQVRHGSLERRYQ